MTLSSWLSHDSATSVSNNYDFRPVPDLDRTHWGGGGGGWKGGKGNPNAALSALTLLAFLFFLNILQSCLRDTIGQNNGMMVMVLPANATATTRAKRETNIDRRGSLGEYYSATHQNWTDLDITNLVHTQVQSYWSNKETKASKKPINNFKTKIHDFENNDNTWDLKATAKNRISTKLSLKKDNNTLDTITMTQTKPKSLITQNKLRDGGLMPVANKGKQRQNGFWTKTISVFINNTIPYIRKIICCSNIAVCEKEGNLFNTKGSSKYDMVRKTMSWFCNGGGKPVACAFYSTPCQD